MCYIFAIHTKYHWHNPHDTPLCDIYNMSGRFVFVYTDMSALYEFLMSLIILLGITLIFVHTYTW